MPQLPPTYMTEAKMCVLDDPWVTRKDGQAEVPPTRTFASYGLPWFAQVVGHDAGTMIAELTLALNNELTLDSLTETMHAHPTIAEAWLEAALHAQGTPLHLPPKRVRK